MDNEQLVRELSQPLRSSKGWLTFLGVLSIVYGVFTALSVIGLLLAWVPIWVGVLLIQAGNAIESAGNSGDSAQMLRAMRKLRTYFVVWGVITLLGLLVSLPLMMFGFSMGFFGHMGGMGPPAI